MTNAAFEKRDTMRRRKFLGLASVIALLAACSKTPKLKRIPAGALVLAFGDSVTFGTGAAAGEDWPSLLAAQTGWRVVNAGIPGDTADSGQRRIKALLDEHHPALAIVEMGGNDFLRRRPQSVIKEDLRSIVQQIKLAGSQVVLIGVPELSLLAIVAGKPSDSKIYGDLADEENIPLIADVFSDVLANPALRADTIHPNAAGYRRMTDGMLAQLKKLGLS
ncbi:MAG: arylesterase [Rhodocyclaceae bacterium]|nr:arylesterase [Rhodocyclaceae bacterium]